MEENKAAILVRLIELIFFAAETQDIARTKDELKERREGNLHVINIEIDLIIEDKVVFKTCSE